MASCKKDSEPTGGISLSMQEITIGAEGGIETIKLKAGDSWVADTESPWITVSPANGFGNVDCKIKIDTTLLANDLRRGTVRFTVKNHTEPINLRVIQTGYGKMIIVKETEVGVPNFAANGKRWFDVELTSNVDFTVNMPDSVKWMRFKDYKFELDRGARPRTVKMRVEWDPNTRTWERLVDVAFNAANAADEAELVRKDALQVIQKPGEKVEDSRAGDSLAIVLCARSLNFDMSRYDGEKMNNWNFVTLWEDSDEGVTEDQVGRVRSVRFASFHTYDGIPYEVRFLRTVEELIIKQNGNAFMKHFTTGEDIAELTQLKRLSLFSMGIDLLDDNFKNLVNLEVLDISGNNFNKVPEILLDLDNFPNLTYLDMTGCRRRWVGTSMKDTTVDEEEWGGFAGEIPENLFKRDKLEYLRMSNNYFYGSVPTMETYEKAYLQSDLDNSNDTLPQLGGNGLHNGYNNPAEYSLLGKPKVLPNARYFSINLNMLTGKVPEWILYHPHLMDWAPDILVYNQDYILTKDLGIKPGFNEAEDKEKIANPEYYFQAYPLKRNL